LLRAILLLLVAITTIVRFSGVVFVLTRDAVNLPALALILTTVMVIYGLILVTRKLMMGSVRLRQFMAFFLLQTAVIVFNLIYVASVHPLPITAPETLVVGTFFDLLINAGILFICIRHLRNGLAPASSAR